MSMIDKETAEALAWLLSGSEKRLRDKAFLAPLGTKLPSAKNTQHKAKGRD